MNNKKNILLVSGSSSLNNGASKCFLNTAIGLSNNQYNVTTLVDSEGDLAKALRKHNIKVIIKRQFWKLWVVHQNTKNNKKIIYWTKFLLYFLIKKYTEISISRLIKREDIDIVHINTSTIGFISFAAAKANVPYVWHIREFLEEHFKSNFVNPKQAFAALQGAAKVIFISNALKDSYINKISSINYEVIYDGVDIEKYFSKRSILQNASINILSVGRMTKAKGHLNIIKSLTPLLLNNPNLHIQIYGANEDPSYTNEVKKYIYQNKLVNSVTYNEFIKDMPSIYKSSDILINNSEIEGFGLTTIEAMLAGNLVIANQKGASSELIDNKKTGYLYNKLNQNELLNIVNSVIQATQESNRIAKQGQSFAKHFSVLTNTKKISSIYNSIK